MAQRKPRKPKAPKVNAARELPADVADDQVRTRGGKPSTYGGPGFAKQAAKLCKLGATDEDLADFFEVSVRTIGYWKVAQPAFAKALQRGKDAADQRVTDSLYARATGYSYDAVKIFMPSGADKPVYAAYREHVPPDVTACIFWLKNRDKENWRDRHDHEVSGELGIRRIERIIVDPAAHRDG